MLLICYLSCCTVLTLFPLGGCQNSTRLNKNFINFLIRDQMINLSSFCLYFNWFLLYDYVPGVPKKCSLVSWAPFLLMNIFWDTLYPKCSKYSMCIQCVFNVYSMCIQIAFNIHSMISNILYIQCLAYWLWLTLIPKF